MTTSELIKVTAEGWARSGCGLPSELDVQDWRPSPLCCARWVVVLTFAGYGDHTAFLGEFGSRAEANRAAGQFRRHLHHAYDRARAKVGAVAVAVG